MISKQGTFIGVILSSIAFLSISHHVSASQVSFVVTPSHTQSETVTVVEARIDPEGTAINAIEGVIGLLGPGVPQVTAVLIETGSSVFTLWPTVPTFSKEDAGIRFVGGSREGFSSEGLLFRMRIFSKTAEQLTVSWLGGSAYQADGNGTPDGISSRSLTISLAQSEPHQINASSFDTTPPVIDTVQISQDPEAFGGAYFLSVHATDDISGISRYEIVENQFSTDITDGVYVLRDQERTSDIVIIAYDQSGNSISVKLPAQYQWLHTVIAIMIFLALLLLLVYVKKRRNAR